MGMFSLKEISSLVGNYTQNAEWPPLFSAGSRVVHQPKKLLASRGRVSELLSRLSAFVCLIGAPFHTRTFYESILKDIFKALLMYVLQSELSVIFFKLKFTGIFECE